MDGFTETVSGSWRGSFSGRGQLQGIGTLRDIALPRAMGGTDEGANPEQLLLGAAAGCLMVTLGIIFEKAGISYQNISITSQLTMDTKLPPTVQSVSHNLKVHSKESAETIAMLAQRAKAGCVIGRALSGSIQVSLNVEVVSAYSGASHLEEVSL